MLRHSNPYNEALSESTAFMEFDLENPNGAFDSALTSEITKYGGEIVPVNGCASRYLFKISHAHIDGLGLTYLYHKLSQSCGVPDAAVDSSAEGMMQGSVNHDYVYEYMSQKVETKRMHTNTFLQRFLAELIESMPTLKSENIGVVVNLETPQFENVESVWGNSIAVLPLQGEKALALAHEPPSVWKEYLISKSERLIALLKKRPISDRKFDSLLVSSIGDLTALPWLNESSTSSLRLGATPMNPKTLNLFLWRNHGVQSILLCGAPNHALFQKKQELFDIWKAVITS